MKKIKRPLALLLAFYIAGIVIGKINFEGQNVISYYILISSIMIFLFYIYSKEKKLTYIKILILVPIIFLLGFFLVQNKLDYKDRMLEKFADENKFIKISGIVEKVDYTKTGLPKIILKSKKTKFIVYLKEKEKILYKQEITIQGNISKFDTKRNPGQFDEQLYMKIRDVDYKIYGRIVEKEKRSSSLLTLLDDLNKRMQSVYDNILQEKEASILKAMVLGDTTNLDENIKELYKKAGITHILAISGLNVSLLGVFIYYFLKFFNLNKRSISAITIVTLVLFAIFVGAGVSVVRAVWMAGVMLFGRIIRKESDLYNSIAFSIFVILLLQPLYLYDIGFQLSYVAVLFIVAGVPVFEKIYFIPSWLRALLGTTVCATIGTAPIIVYNFYTFSVYSILINVILVPLSTILLLFSILAGVIGLIWIPLAKFTIGIVYYILKFYEWFCIIAVNLKNSTMVIGSPSIICLILYYVIIITIILYYQPKSKLNKQYKNIIITICILIFFVINIMPKQLQVTYLDVGQGDCEIIYTPIGKTIVIDGGGDIKKDWNEKNTGTNIVYPYLQYKGINKIDVMILSHSDYDHIRGLTELIDVIPIKKILIPIANLGNEKNMNTLFQKAQQKNISIYKIKQDNYFDIENIHFKCLYPNKEMENVQETPNYYSVVLEMNYKKINFLFTGDIENPQEDKLVNTFDKTKTYIFKVPHHGSNSSSSEKFIQNLNPKVAVISYGNNNTYGHPNKEVVERYKNKNIKLYKTGQDGAIQMFSDGESVKIKKMINY